MKTVVAILIAGIATAAAAEVWYVPGWNRTTETNGLAYTSCTNVFKGKVVWNVPYVKVRCKLTRGGSFSGLTVRSLGRDGVANGSSGDKTQDDIIVR